jgi:glycosyltransferase involved in cell wall biosynthesis
MYGTPVLGADIGGIPELIRVGETGELFESGNAQELKSKIESLWSDMGKIGRYERSCKELPFRNVNQYCTVLLRLIAGECGESGYEQSQRVLDR